MWETQPNNDPFISFKLYSKLLIPFECCLWVIIIKHIFLEKLRKKGLKKNENLIKYPQVPCKLSRREGGKKEKG
jgi:hypothetical protein